MSIAPGTRLGSYDVVGPIGAGGMGEVYRARDTKLGRDVAIKTLPASLSADPARLARFEREARMLASLNHPHIGAIYGVEEWNGVTALVLELVEGLTIAQKLSARKGAASGLPMAEALSIARQIADALDAAHERGIVHRDLKPDNIIVTADGIAKVLDFGIAKPEPAGMDDESTGSPTFAPTATGEVLGTAPYMSPEQARGQSVDKRTDIWAFGCVVYEVLSGRAAFKGATTSDTIAAILEREPDWTLLPATTPANTRRVIARCLEKDISRRFRDIGDVRVELDDAPAATGPRGSLRFVERIGWVALVVVAVIGAALVAPAWRPAPAPEEIRFDLSLPPGMSSSFAQIALSPDGRHLVTAPTFEGKSLLWLRPLESQTGRELRGTEGAIFPFWSPDSRSIAFFAGRKLKRINIESDAVENVTDIKIGRGGAWLPDGTMIFAPDVSGPLMRVSAAGGQAEAFTHLAPGQNDHRAPFILPDGQHFLYYSRGTAEARGVYVALMNGTESRRLLDAEAAAVYSPSGHVLFVRQGELYSQPFDLRRLELNGAPIKVASQIQVNGGVSLASLTASTTGVVAFGKGNVPRTQFVWRDRSGKQIGTIGGPETSVANPNLSPDGQHVALSRIIDGNWDIWLMDLHGAMSRMTSDPALDFFPLFDHDGSRLIFQSSRNGHPDIFARSLNTGAGEELLLGTPEPKVPSDVSPDGRFLLYNVNGGSGTSSDIWYAPLVGDTTPHPFVQAPGSDSDAQFSPDGKWVAYQSYETGNADIRVQPFPGPGDRIRVSPAGGIQVRWARRGLELFYLATPASQLTLTSVTLTVGADGKATPSAPRPLFQTAFNNTLSPSQTMRPQYVVANDGQRFLMNSLTGSIDPLSITVIANWKGR